MSRATTFARRWLIPDVGGVIPWIVCVVVISVGMNLLGEHGLTRFLLVMLAWLVAIRWYSHWRAP